MVLAPGSLITRHYSCSVCEVQEQTRHLQDEHPAFSPAAAARGFSGEGPSHCYHEGERGVRKQALSLQGIKWGLAKPFLSHLSGVWPFLEELWRTEFAH